MRHRLLQLFAAFVASIAVHASATPAVPADAVVSSITQQVLASSATLGPLADAAGIVKIDASAIVSPANSVTINAAAMNTALAILGGAGAETGLPRRRRRESGNRA